MSGCPPRSVGKALFQTTMVNVAYELANLIRGQVTARTTPKSWWENSDRDGRGRRRHRQLLVDGAAIVFR